MVAQSLAFHHEMDTRRSARIFSPEPIPLEAVRQCIDVACTAHRARISSLGPFVW